MLSRIWLYVVLLFFVVPAFAVVAPTSVEQGKIATLASGDKPYEKLQPSGGTAVSQPARGDPSRFELVYTAGAIAGSYEVGYETAGTPGKVSVVVTSPKAPLPASSASSPALSDNPYSPAAKILFALFALAVVLESGLAVIFNWRPFVQFFDARGAKTVIAVVISLLFVVAFDLDLADSLVKSFFPDSSSPGPIGPFITALVLAGGSSGVNNILVALGFRSAKTAESVTPRPPATKAWVAVSLRRKKAVGPAYVLV